MAANGVYMICLGLEEPTKNYIKNKKLDEACALLKKYNIMIYMSFIIDPLKAIAEQDEAELYRILEERVYELQPEMICGNFLMPFPGTPLWDSYADKVKAEMYKHYTSKIPFLCEEQESHDRQKYNMFRFQWEYFTSDFYNTNVRKFETNDTLHLRFKQLYARFEDNVTDESRFQSFDAWS
jgi:radical SAM superfamily enzyme YgiQ (UPF0313 family)